MAMMRIANSRNKTKDEKRDGDFRIITKRNL